MPQHHHHDGYASFVHINYEKPNQVLYREEKITNNKICDFTFISSPGIVKPNEQVSYSATGGGPSQGWSGGAGIPVLDDHGDDDQGDDDQVDDDLGDDDQGDDDHGEGAPVVMIRALVMVW